LGLWLDYFGVVCYHLTTLKSLSIEKYIAGGVMDDYITLSAIVPIALGIVIVFISILRSKSLFLAMPFVIARNRSAIVRFLRHHKLLMILFLVGYMVIAVALVMGVSFFNAPLIGATCFLVAVFIYLSSLLESRMMGEIQRTLRVLMPICAKCKKMRSPDSDGADPDAWMDLEKYIVTETGTQLTHGLCPECTKETIDEHNRTLKAADKPEA
jgi:hypothetical protein